MYFFYLSIYLAISLSICLFIYLSLYLSVYQFLGVLVCLLKPVAHRPVGSVLNNLYELVLALFQQFVDALPKAQLVEAIGCLDLPDRASWFGDPNFGSRLFIRTEYSDLAFLVMNSVPGGINLVVGNPGAGKSSFLGFLLWRLITLDVPVLFDYCSNPCVPTLFRPGQPAMFAPVNQPDLFLSILATLPIHFYLFDSPEHPQARQPATALTGVTVIATSPDEGNFYSVRKKPKLRFLLLPTWPWPILNDFRLCCAPGMASLTKLT